MADTQANPPLKDGQDQQEQLEEELERETDDVIYDELRQKGADESQRSALLYMSLWEVMHASRRVLHLPDDTLYTAAVVMPMIARSANYPLTLVAHSVKLVILMLACIALQGGLIVSLSHARVDLPGLDGVPSLCTYGQDVGHNRKPYGPTGQVYEKSYGNVETDYGKLMIRNTLYEVMKKVGVENPGVGPVEYGMESGTCRFVCIAVFSVAICSELFSMETMARFLWHCPTLASKYGRDATYRGLAEEGRWVEFTEDAGSEKAKELWELIDKSSLDHIRFRCSGMPLTWKLCSLAMLVARSVVVIMTFWNGVSFLLNTGGIVDLILNSLAIIFIVDLDRLMFTALSRGLTKDILHRLEPYRVKPKVGDLHRELARRSQTEFNWGCWEFTKRFLTVNGSSLILFALTVGSHFVYFYKHCELQLLPLDFTDWLSKSYFHGQTRFFGGWEFIFGSWVSGPTTDPYGGDVTCQPAVHKIESEGVQNPVVGCGLPKPWSP